MSELHQQLQHTLQRIEIELRTVDLWEETPPSPLALSSREPFCVDTLDFTQWLQWVFLPRMEDVLNQGLELPAQSSIHILAHEALKDMQQDMARLVDSIREFDLLITNQ